MSVTAERLNQIASDVPNLTATQRQAVEDFIQDLVCNFGWGWSHLVGSRTAVKPARKPVAGKPWQTYTVASDNRPSRCRGCGSQHGMGHFPDCGPAIKPMKFLKSVKPGTAASIKLHGIIVKQQIESNDMFRHRGGSEADAQKQRAKRWQEAAERVDKDRRVEVRRVEIDRRQAA